MRRILLLFLLLPLVSGAQAVDSLQKLVNACRVDSQKVRLLNELAKACDDVRDSRSGTFAQQALELARKTDNARGEATALRILGFASESQSHYGDAIGWYQQSYEKFKILNDTIGMAKALSNMANSEYFIGDYASSAEHAMQAVTFYEAVKFYEGIGSARIALGNVYVDQKLYKEAMSNYREAYKAALHFPDKPSFKARALASMGNVYQFRKNWDSAVIFYSDAKKIFEDSDLPFETSICINNMALVKREQKQPEEAEKLMRSCLSIRESLHDTDGICTCYENLSGMMVDRQLYDSSLYYLRNAMFLVSRTGSKPQRLTCYQGFADTYAEMGKSDSAYFYLSKYTALNDSLTGEENINALSQLKERYYSEKRKHDLDLSEAARVADNARSMRNMAFLGIGLVLLIAVSIVMYTRYRAKQKLSDTLTRQNMEITMQKNEITDSITYARRIQESILPPEHTVRQLLPHSFIFYLPKDIVSGDFYWVDEVDGKIIFAAVDCTGHGVPGALMSVVGFNLLNQAVNEKRLTRPSDILQHLDYGVNKLLRQSDSDNTVKDGMDLALCSYDPKTRTLQYAGVFNPLYLVQNGKLREIKADKFPIGLNVDGVVDTFTNHTIQLEPGDMVYIFSDGYADQFGGPAGKKFKYTQLRSLLLSIASLEPEAQREKVQQDFMQWKGLHEQVDDILLIGMKVK